MCQVRRGRSCFVTAGPLPGRMLRGGCAGGAYAGATMPAFCDVAVPVPVDAVFTYRIPTGVQPVVGGRVLVPFRQQRMSGVITELHDRPPRADNKEIQTKNLFRVLDSAPVLDEQLLRLGRWIAGYYLAPLGEVFRP